MREADGGESVRFLAVFNTSAGCRFRAWSASRPAPLTQAVGRRKKMREARLKFDVELLQSARTHSAANINMKRTSRYFGGAECASWLVVSRAHPAIAALSSPLPIEQLSLLRRKCFERGSSKESRSPSQACAQHSVQPTNGSLRVF